MRYVSLDDLRAAAEKDVEIDGVVYRVRRLSLSEVTELREGLPIQVDEEGRKVLEVDEAEAARRAERTLVRALVNPKVDEETVKLIPPAHVIRLFHEALREVSSSRPFPRSDSEESSSPSTGSGSDTAADPASS